MPFAGARDHRRRGFESASFSPHKIGRSGMRELPATFRMRSPRGPLPELPRLPLPRSNNSASRPLVLRVRGLRASPSSPADADSVIANPQAKRTSAVKYLDLNTPGTSVRKGLAQDIAADTVKFVLDHRSPGLSAGLRLRCESPCGCSRRPGPRQFLTGGSE